MNEPSPQSPRSPGRHASRLRIFVPLAVVAVVLAGATAAFASGAFESNDSGFDSARDIAERGSVPSSTTTSSLPGIERLGDDNSVSGGNETRSEDQTFVDVPDGTTQTFAAGAAGSVTISRSGATLSVVSVNASAGWVVEVEQGTGVELEVKFVNRATRIDFNAEFEDGVVRIRVRVRSDAPVAGSATPAASTGNPGPGNSGPGNPNDDDRNDDNSGPGSDDDRNDDNSGPGSDDSDDNSGPGSGSSGSGHGGSHSDDD